MDCAKQPESGLQDPAACHYRDETVWLAACLPRCLKQPEVGLKCPRGRCAHTQPGALGSNTLPHGLVCPFRFWLPLPCPWAAVLLGGGGAGLLTWLLALAGKFWDLYMLEPH